MLSINFYLKHTHTHKHTHSNFEIISIQLSSPHRHQAIRWDILFAVRWEHANAFSRPKVCLLSYKVSNQCRNKFMITKRKNLETNMKLWEQEELRA